jgi:hypothetical protein
MRAQKKASASADTVELYERLVATNPKVERKGATHPYTSLNGLCSLTCTHRGQWL